MKFIDLSGPLMPHQLPGVDFFCVEKTIYNDKGNPVGEFRLSHHRTKESAIEALELYVQSNLLDWLMAGSHGWCEGGCAICDDVPEVTEEENANWLSSMIEYSETKASLEEIVYEGPPPQGEERFALGLDWSYSDEIWPDGYFSSMPVEALIERWREVTGGRESLQLIRVTEEDPSLWKKRQNSRSLKRNKKGDAPKKKGHLTVIK